MRKNHNLFTKERYLVKYLSSIKDDRGQILIITGFLVMAALLCLGLTIDVGQLLIHNIQLQNTADAGAYRGGEVLASALNTIVIGNGTLIGLGILTIPTHGGTLKEIRAVQSLQDALAQTAPAASVAIAAAVAIGGNNADLALPLNRLTSTSFMPSLMVRRAYFMPFFFGHRFPLWMSDDYRTSSSKPYGDRFLRLGVTTGARSTMFLGRIMQMEFFVPQSLAGAESFIVGGNFWPIPRPTYEANLARVSSTLLNQLGISL